MKNFSLPQTFYFTVSIRLSLRVRHEVSYSEVLQSVIDSVNGIFDEDILIEYVRKNEWWICDLTGDFKDCMFCVWAKITKRGRNYDKLMEEVISQISAFSTWSEELDYQSVEILEISGESSWIAYL